MNIGVDEPVQPDLILIINKFKSELETMQMNVNVINSKISRIKDFPSKKTNVNSEICKEEPDKSILNEYWGCLDKMNYYNSILEDINTNLTSLVG